MKTYSVMVSGRVTKKYNIESECKEDAMSEALDYLNEIATIDYAEPDTLSEVIIDAYEIETDESEEENATDK